MKVITLLLLSALALQSASTPTKPEVAQALRGAVALQDTMRDPDSFVIEKVFILTNKKGYQSTCYEYRSRNGFGGMNRDAATYTEYKGKAKVSPNSLWGPKCTDIEKGRLPFVDITSEFQEAGKAEKTGKTEEIRSQ